MNSHPRLILKVAKQIRSTGKQQLLKIIVSFACSAVLISIAPPSYALDLNALPTGGKVVAGQGSISQSNAQMIVNQQSDRMVANWSSFNIGQNAMVQFQQPGAGSVALNRILDQNPSQIFGSLRSNGQVFLMNPSGIFFSPTASVDVGGLVASSLNITNDNFMAGRYLFEKSGQAGSIVNQGSIHTADGGYVAFLAPQVSNVGSISSKSGAVALAAGDKISLDFVGDNLVNFTVDQGSINALVENKGLIKADGGMVYLTAKAADSLTQSVVNNTGVIAAQGISERGGRIVLDAIGGQDTISGTLDASGKQAGQQGGTIKVLGDKVGLFSGAFVDVGGDSGGGTALIGGNWQGKGNEANARRTYVAETARIDASATGNGDGGKVVVWADEINRYYGSIGAKGGLHGGNGGRVEVSGKTFLDFNGHIDTTAAKGQGGSLLLDPTNITVATADPGGGAVSRSAASDLDAFDTNPAETSWITPTDLVTLLNTAAVTLKAYNDITVSNAVDSSGNAGNFGLTMYAGRSILINDNIKLRGAFAAYANDMGGGGTNRGAGTADFTMAAGKTIDTSNQNKAITIQIGAGDQNPSGTATVKGLSSGSGNISVTADSVDLSGGVDSIGGTGTVTLQPMKSSCPIVIGAAGGAGDFALDTTELATLKDGFSSIKLGKIGGTSTATISGSLSFKDPVEIYSSGVGGMITLDASAAINTNGNSIQFYAGSGDTGAFTQTAGATISAGAGAITISADVLTLQGAADSISCSSHASSSVSLYPNTGARAIDVGADDAAGLFALNAAEILTLKAGFSRIQIGSTTATGGLTLSAPLSFNDPLTLRLGGGSFTVNATPTVNGALQFVGGSPINLNASVNATGGVSFAGAVTVGAGTHTATFASSLAHGANNFTVTADDVALSGNWTGTGKRTLQPTTITQTIGLGTGAGSFSLSAAELGYLNNSTPETVIIGRANGTGAINGSAFSFGRPLVLQGGAITQTGPWTLSDTVSLQSGNNDIKLNHPNNNFSSLVTVVSGKNVTLINADAMTLGAVTATGLVDIATKTNDLTITGAISTSDATASAIKLNAGSDAAAGTSTGGNIIVDSDCTVTLGAGGIAKLYTGSIAGSTGLTGLIGSGSGRFRYNSDEATSNYTDTLVAGKNAVYREKPMLTVTPGNLAITYGDATHFATTIGTAYVNGDTSAGTVSGTANWTFGGVSSTSGKPVVGIHDVIYNSGLVSSLGYGFANNGASSNELTVGKANLAVTGLIANNKTYDTTTTAMLSGTAAVTALGADVVNIGGTASGTFADKNAGTGKAVTVTGNTISGADAGNYNLVQQAGLTADIGKANLAVTGLIANNKTYDTTTTAMLSGTAAVTALGTDVVTIGGTASGTFTDKNVGTGKAVTVTGNTISGADAGNYNLVQQAGLTADIGKANLAVTGLIANNKTYDTTTTATLSGTAAVTALGTDVVTIGGTASGTFTDKNVGTGKAVTVTGSTISGTDAGNYNLVQQAGLTADIGKANLAVTGLIANNKTYDGTTTAMLSGTATVTALGTDVVTIGGTASGTFADKNVGTGKAVTVTGNTISGADAGNYNLVQQTGLTADILVPTVVRIQEVINSTYGNQMASIIVNDTTRTLGNETLMLSSSTLINPITFNKTGESLTLAIVSASTSDTLAEIGVLTVFSQTGTEPPVAQGSYKVLESSSYITLIPVLTKPGTPPRDAIPVDASIPFTLTVKGRASLALSAWVSPQGVLVITAPEATATLGLHQVVLLGMQVVQQEMKLDLKKLKSVLVEVNDGRRV